MNPALLKGKLRTYEGFAMSPTAVHRPLTKRVKNGQKRLVRYYVSQKAIQHGFASCAIKSINGEHLDELIRGIVLSHLKDEALCHQEPQVRDHWVRHTIEKVEVRPDQLIIKLNKKRTREVLEQNFHTPEDSDDQGPVCLFEPEVIESEQILELRLAIQIKRFDGKRLLLTPEGKDLVIPAKPEPKPHLVNAVGLAYRWLEELTSTEATSKDYAEKIGINPRRLQKLLPLTYLSPRVLKAILTGTLSPRITLEDLLRVAEDLDWNRQHQALDLPS
ncbi:MAG: hypothetical protein RIG82_10170 [Phycisphaeraceae bacterium]